MRDVVARRACDCAHVDTVVVVKALVFRRDERAQYISIDLIDREPAAALTLCRTCGSQRQTVAVLQGHARHRLWLRELFRQRQRDPGASQRRECCDNKDSSAGYRSHHRTVKVLPPVRPFTAGLYISSACAGGTMNTPAVVARARYVAV